MKHLLLVTAAWALAAVPALATEATFERTLTANGRIELSVATGSGHIHLKQGEGNQVHVFARVKSNWGGSEEKVKEIAANPPIEQTGNIIRIGERHENLHNISIDYDIEAPANAYLDAGSGSGNVTDTGVGENAKLEHRFRQHSCHRPARGIYRQHRLGRHLCGTNRRRRCEGGNRFRHDRIEER